ncbi:MAG: cobalamin biosynthesis protein CobD [Ktedonobacteraceae bacterium]|nr:cobalamin biosynthesis protein CobD [Ktedonobacteraceae bacterium]
MRKKTQEHSISPESGIAVFLALGFDFLGEPPAAWHPVVWYGKLIQKLEHAAPAQPLAQFFYGIGMLILATPAALLPTSAIHWLARRIRTGTRLRKVRFVLSVLLEGMALKPFFALRMLAEAGHKVRECLEQDDLAAARQALQALVSRDRSQLTAELVSAAVIESLAENLSDSVVAPLFYYLLFGLPGAATYRLLNTFDSMIGYHGRYEYLGKAAAHVDDLLNFLPARLTALLIVVCAPLFGGNRGKALSIWRRDAQKTASPNAGQPMAAAAGALGLQLEKVGHYTLGDRERTITAHDIHHAEQIVWWIGCSVIALVGLLKLFWRSQDE